MGQNMKAILAHITAEPGQWTALALAEDFGIGPRSIRFSLRILKQHGLIESRVGTCETCAGHVHHYFPKGHGVPSRTAPS